jgi:hypothetical protein
MTITPDVVAGAQPVPRTVLFDGVEAPEGYGHLSKLNRILAVLDGTDADAMIVGKTARSLISMAPRSSCSCVMSDRLIS